MTLNSDLSWIVSAKPACLPVKAVAWFAKNFMTAMILPIIRHVEINASVDIDWCRRQSPWQPTRTTSRAGRISLGIYLWIALKRIVSDYNALAELRVGKGPICRIRRWRARAAKRKVSFNLSDWVGAFLFCEVQMWYRDEKRCVVCPLRSHSMPREKDCSSSSATGDCSRGVRPWRF